METVAAGLADPAGALRSEERMLRGPEASRARLVRRGEDRAADRAVRPSTAAAALVPPGSLGRRGGRSAGRPARTLPGCWSWWRPTAARFEACHVELVQLLLEPFSVALENDHRLREMAALREAAEADKRSLLTRLGRKAIGDTVVGADSGLRAVMERVELVARSDVPVLIVGETGTGKELVARLIHNRSPRAAGPVHSRQLRGDPFAS